MFNRILVLSGGLVLSAAMASAAPTPSTSTSSNRSALDLSAATTADRKDLQVFKDVAKSVNRYVHFTIFDDVAAEVKDGVVTLTGRVTMPYKREDIMNRVANVAGVLEVRDYIEVLPVSQSDDRLRRQISRAIYANPNFWNYALGPNPSIHIIVEHGHVTLTGVVNSEIDRRLARSLVDQFGVMSVKNELKTDMEIRDASDKS
jgi:hyperosmotically inducible protein